MEETEFQKRLRGGLGLRVGPEMAKYLLKRMAEGKLGDAAIAAMGGDAKTGVPLRTVIKVEALRALAKEDRPNLET
jgi:hypothetical protein